MKARLVSFNSIKEPKLDLSVFLASYLKISQRQISNGINVMGVNRIRAQQRLICKLKSHH